MQQSTVNLNILILFHLDAISQNFASSKKRRRQEENGTYEHYQRQQKKRQRIKRVKKFVWLFNTLLSYQLVCLSKFQKVWIQVWSKNRVRFKLHCRSADKKHFMPRATLTSDTRALQIIYCRNCSPFGIIKTYFTFSLLETG